MDSVARGERAHQNGLHVSVSGFDSPWEHFLHVYRNSFLSVVVNLD